MKLDGQVVLHAPIERVWESLTDPAVLVRTIPGCERLEAIGPDSYAMVVTAGVAAVRGSYSGEVTLSDQRPPSALRLTASGAGSPGTVRTEVHVSLADAGGEATTVCYRADAEVGGAVAGVGQRVLSSVARRMAGEFFTAVDDVLAGRAPLPEPAAAATAPGEPAVFVAPRRAAQPDGFVRGLVVGAAIALAGVLVGGFVRGRHPRADRRSDRRWLAAAITAAAAGSRRFIARRAG
jgi:hypothetical protein